MPHSTRVRQGRADRRTKAQKQHHWSLTVTVGGDAWGFAIIRRDYSPNGTLVNADLVRQEWVSTPISAVEMDAVLKRFGAMLRHCASQSSSPG